MKLAALAALVMLVASCCPCRKHRKGDGKPFVGTEWQLVQLNGRASMFKPRKMSKMLKFLPCRADFMPPLCYNTSKWGIAARRAPVVLTTQDGSKEYL